jgi:hypothetical protein
MENCRSCNARLTPGIDWCPQCYTRTGPPQPGMPQIGTPHLQGRVPGAAATTSQPLTARELPPDLLTQMPTYSRMKGGETSFGWVGRTVLSIGVFILGVIGYFVVVGNTGIAISWHSFELYLPVFFTVGGAMLWAVWRPARIDSRRG